ncbi:MAG: DUF2807 domain-containing protein [Novosphingobium sp.]|nr:DUF2807 domain-containing protein [Novosphingobium sp.]
MIRKLLIVAVSAAMLALVSIGAAVAIGGPALRKAFEERHVIVLGDEYEGPTTTRQFEFDAAKMLVIDMPVDLRFERSDTASMEVEGPQEAIDDLVYENGKLGFSKGGKAKHASLSVVIKAPRLLGLHLDAPADVELFDLDQENFEVQSAGAADVTATGKIAKLRLESDGAADFDFENVEVTDASVEINGAGDIELSAKGIVDLEINGAGDVTLHTKPAKLNSTINGIGDVKHAY